MLRLAALRTASRVPRCAAAAVSAPARSFAAEAPAQKADLDWDVLNEAVSSDAGKRELAQLRTTFLDLDQKFTDLSKEPEPIDWAAWRKEVDPQLVDAFKKAYDTLPLPKYEDKGLAEVEKTFDELLAQASELSAHSEKRIAEIEAEIKAVDVELDRVSKLTVDEVLGDEPELGKKLHAEISAGNFMP